MKLTKTELKKLIIKEFRRKGPTSFGDESLSPEQIEDFAAEIAKETIATDLRRDLVGHKKMRKLGIAPAPADFIRLMARVDSILDDAPHPYGRFRDGDKLTESYVRQVIREEYQAVLKEEKKKKSAKDKMKCNSPRRIRKGEAGHGKKKFVVKACDGGTEKIIRYGDAGLKIKRKQKGRRKNFRARHNCDNPGSKLKARYWSCKNW